MAEARKVGSEKSAKRALMLDAAEEILLEDGYAAVTSRSVAAKVGVAAPLVHYYFPTVDDLFVALLRRGAEANLERLETALAGPEPLRALWSFSTDPRGPALMTELTAAARHRKALRAEVAELSERARAIQVEALAGVLEEYGLDPVDFPPELVAATIQALGLLTVRERALGIDVGPDVVSSSVEAHLERLESKRRAQPPAQLPDEG